ncbi:hypothetical protein M8J75_015558 [Diaphorina citri]|nr:hypothetical protein M8J75_015558 [Diaphorina citri]
MNRFDSPPAEAISKGKIRSDILNIFKPCLIYMKVFGLVPYTLNMEMTPFSLLINLLFSSATFLYIFRHYVLDTRFLSVKSYDLIPAIILYFYSMTLCKKILHKLVQIDSHLLSLLHIPPSNISLTRYVHTMTATNLIVYICLAASTRILFPYPTLKVIGFFVPLINVDVILILLVSKISTLQSRFETLNTVINRVATANDRNENKTVNSVERHRFHRLGSAGAKLINVMRLGRVIPEKFTEISNADGLCTDVNNRYSYQILATLCIHFLSLCSAIYSCIALGITASKVGLGLVELQKIIYYTSWLVATFFWISLITKTSHDTMAQSKEAKRLIHNYVIQDTFPDIEQELDLLVRHLEKHTVQFTAHGFFLVDYKIFCMH